MENVELLASSDTEEGDDGEEEEDDGEEEEDGYWDSLTG